MENDNVSRHINDSEETEVDQRSTNSVVSLVTRLSSLLLQRRGNSTAAAANAKSTDEKQSTNSMYNMRSSMQTQKQIDFNKVRNELKQFQGGFRNEQKKTRKSESDVDAKLFKK